jgi:hypothetical protein
MIGVMVSPLRGADGNVEFLAHFHPHTPVPPGPLRDRLPIDALVTGLDGGFA